LLEDFSWASSFLVKLLDVELADRSIKLDLFLRRLGEPYLKLFTYYAIQHSVFSCLISSEYFLVRVEHTIEFSCKCVVQDLERIKLSFPEFINNFLLSLSLEIVFSVP